MKLKIRDLFKHCENKGISTYEFFKSRGFKDTINSFNGEHKITMVKRDCWVDCGYQSFCCHMDTELNIVGGLI